MNKYNVARGGFILGRHYRAGSTVELVEQQAAPLLREGRIDENVKKPARKTRKRAKKAEPTTAQTESKPAAADADSGDDGEKTTK